MKKLLFLVLFFCSSLCVNAQTTHAIRVGGGIYNSPLGDYGAEKTGGVAVDIYSNIPIKRYSTWIFSLGATFAGLDIPAGDGYFYGSLQVGKKSIIGNGKYFVCKAGAALGSGFNGGGIIGPCADLSFEDNHFVVGVSAHYSLTQGEGDYYNEPDDHFYYTPWGANLTLGYKF